MNPLPPISDLALPVAQFAERMRAEARKALVGQELPFDLMLVALLARGHVLLEGVPGTAKTLMAKVLAHLVRAAFQRRLTGVGLQDDRPDAGALSSSG